MTEQYRHSQQSLIPLRDVPVGMAVVSLDEAPQAAAEGRASPRPLTGSASMLTVYPTGTVLDCHVRPLSRTRFPRQTSEPASAFPGLLSVRSEEHTSELQSRQY